MEPGERNAPKARYGALYEDFAGILFRLDPQGINFETNLDEHEPLVGTILPRVVNANSPGEIIPILKEELFRWFGSEVVNPRASADEIAMELWRALERGRT